MSNALGSYLSNLRAVKKMTLREVEKATGKEVSNAYLSQLEKGKIKKPSPNILHALASIYRASYENLMEKAGYITTAGMRSDYTKRGRVAIFEDYNLTKDEEEELLKYLAFLRFKEN